MTGLRAGQRPDVLVLAHVGDAGARALAAAVRSAGGSVRVVSDVDLTVGARWVHLPRCGPSAASGTGGLLPGDGRSSDGILSDGVVLADGTVLDGATIRLVCSRLRSIVPPGFARATRGDLEYAAVEMQAVLVSWLESLAVPVVNAPSPEWLGGFQPDVLTALTAAASCGLPVVPFTVTTREDRVALRDSAGRPLCRVGMDDWALPTRLPHESPATGSSPPRRLSGPPRARPAFALGGVRPAGSLLVAGSGVIGDLCDVDALGEGAVALARALGLTVMELFLATSADPGDRPGRRDHRRVAVAGVSSVPSLAEPGQAQATAALLLSLGKAPAPEAWPGARELASAGSGRPAVGPR